MRALKNFILGWAGRLSLHQQKILMLLGSERAQAMQNTGQLASLSEAEFRVFSQFGEDGIIQYLLSKIEIPNKVFIEFGVENYLESNTRFLLQHNNWSGLVMDGSAANIRFIKKDPISWRHDLTAVQAFITKENINALITAYTKETDIGLLSIDIDGNDYWILQALDVRPRILVCEYNNIFGGTHAVTIPYSADFTRRKAHYSDLYFGASLRAITTLADSKGYDFVGVNSTGINAFFVRKDLAAPFAKKKVEEVFVSSKNRESRDKKGRLNFLRGEERLKAIRDMKVVDLSKSMLVTIAELYSL